MLHSKLYKNQIEQISLKYDLITHLKIMRIEHYPQSDIISTFYESIIMI